MKILFENENVVLILKEALWLSVPGRFKDERPVAGLKVQEIFGKQIFPVHRLDYEVSGLLLFAKSAPVHKELNELFEARKIKKIYEALSQGSPPENGSTFRWENLLVRGKKRSFEAPHGKKALTLARYLGQKSSGPLHWELEPVTGRSHQLRVHMSQAGFPILGDSLYASTQSYSAPGIALKAVRLTLPKESAEKFGCPEQFSLPVEEAF